MYSVNMSIAFRDAFLALHARKRRGPWHRDLIRTACREACEYTDVPLTRLYRRVLGVCRQVNKVQEER